MERLLIPGTSRFLGVGAIIIIVSDPTTKYILQYGWYSYNSEVKCNWYLSRLPDMTVVEVTDDILYNCQVVVEGEGPSPGPSCYDPSCPSCPYVDPATVRHDVEKYLVATEYMLGQLLWLVPGRLYQVAQDFTSSSSAETVEDNFALDIAANYLVSIS